MGKNSEVSFTQITAEGKILEPSMREAVLNLLVDEEAWVMIFDGVRQLHGEIKKYGEYIGEATNNTAEYKAVILALQKAKLILGKKEAKDADVEVNMDSELIVRQLSGQYKIKEESLKPLFLEVWNLKQDFKSVAFNHIPREKNKEADTLVNEAIDNA